MSLHFHWFLPTNGDGRDIVGGGHGVATGSAGAIRPASLGYLGQVARSAEQLGFEAALTPTGAWCEDAWLATAMLTEVTERLKFIVAFRPGRASSALACCADGGHVQRHPEAAAARRGDRRRVRRAARADGDFCRRPRTLPRCADFWTSSNGSGTARPLRTTARTCAWRGDARLALRPDPLVPPL